MTIVAQIAEVIPESTGNDYFTPPEELSPLTKARATDINTLASAIGAAFDRLPGQDALKQDRVSYAVDTGDVANAYLVTLPHAPVAYVDGMAVVMRPTRANTGAASINVNGLGVIAIKRNDSTDPLAGDILVGGTVTLRYNSAANAFILPATVASQSASASADAASAAASAASALAAVPYRGATPPASPLPNSEWISSTTGRHYVWLQDTNGYQWVEAFAAQVVDNDTLVGEHRAALAAPTGAAQVGHEDGTVAEALNAKADRTSGDMQYSLQMTEGVDPSAYAWSYAAAMRVPANNPGIRHWAVMGHVDVPADAVIPSGSVFHDHAGVSGRATSLAKNSRIWGGVMLAHREGSVANNAEMGQCVGLEVDVNNMTGYDADNLAGDGDIGGMIVATGGSNALKFGVLFSKIASSLGCFFTGLYFRGDCLSHDGFGIYFGNVQPNAGVYFGEDFTGAKAVSVRNSKDIEFRLTSGPAARIRGDGTALLMNVGTGGLALVNSANDNIIGTMSDDGRWTPKRGVMTSTDITSAETNLDASIGNMFVLAAPSASTITAINNGVKGQELTLLFTNVNTTIQSNAQIHLAGAASFVGSSYDCLVLVFDGVNWCEKSRSVN